MKLALTRVRKGYMLNRDLRLMLLTHCGIMLFKPPIAYYF